VTYALIAACMLAFLAAERGTRGVDAAAETGLKQASDYFIEHPYLKPPRRLQPHLDAAVVERARESYREARQRRGAPELSLGIQRRQQATLDGLVWQSLAEFDSLPSQRWGMRPERQDPLSFVTHVFIHAGWLHLVGNLAFLLILGFYLECAWGGPLFALLVLGGAVVSAGAVAVASPGLANPLIGMSGVVATLLGAFAIRLAGIWKEGAYPFLLVTGVTWLLLPVWLGTEWSVALAIEGGPLRVGTGGVSYWGFAAGSTFGAAVAAAIWLLGAEETLLNPAMDSKRTVMASPLLDRAVEACGEGHFHEAFRLLSSLLSREPDNRDAALAMWDVASEFGRPGAAAAGMLRVIRDDIQRRDHAAAVDHWLSLAAQGLAADAEPALLTRMALLLREANQPAAAVKALHLALERSENDNTTAVASRVARAARDLDPDTAEEAAWRALGCVELDFQERQNLEDLLGQLYRERKQQDDLLEISTPTRARTAEEKSLLERQLEGAAPSETVQWEAPELLEDFEKPDASPAPIDLDFATRTLRVVAARPLGLDSDGLVIEIEGGSKRRMGFAKVDALSVVAVHGLGPKPVILMDLLLNWLGQDGAELKVVRLRADRFDPRRLVTGSEAPLEALRLFADCLLGATRGVPLPDLQAVRGRPFAVLESLEAYHRDVLMAQEAADAHGRTGEV
jgi:membrane associated rhomboid family serine protease